jgi:hypothetical protein
MTPSRRGRTGLLLLAFVANAGCAMLTSHPEQNPRINFSAHTASGRVIIDKIDDGQNAVLKPWDLRTGPQFVLKTASGSTTAALWASRETTLIRSAPDASTPVIGTVDSSWDDYAIRFELKPRGGGTFSTSPFRRIDGDASSALGQRAYSLVDLRGIYQAELADDAGNPAGWMRVQVGSRFKPEHVYDGVLPREINGPLAVALVAKLDATLADIEAQAYDPYIGN